MKNWDITISQMILVAIGGYYLYHAIGTFRHITRGSPQAFVFLMTIAVILLGLALALQQIRSYRARKEKYGETASIF